MSPAATDALLACEAAIDCYRLDVAALRVRRNSGDITLASYVRRVTVAAEVPRAAQASLISAVAALSDEEADDLDDPTLARLDAALNWM